MVRIMAQVGLISLSISLTSRSDPVFPLPKKDKLLSSGPEGNTLILSLLFGSGGEHCDHKLAVEVRGTL